MNELDHFRLIDAYVGARVARGDLARSSADAIRRTLRQWVRHVDFATPRRWTVDEVATWVNDVALRANTRKSRLTKLRPFARWLILEGRLASDPTIGIGRIRVPRSTPRDLTPDEVGRLVGACPDERARLIVLLMVQLGLRCGDVARIRVEDFDVRRRLLHVRAKGGRGEPTHWEPIPDEAWGALGRWLPVLGHSSGPLLRSYQHADRGLSPQWVSKLVGGWIRVAGLKDLPWDGRSAHALRHSCAQHMIDGGADLREVQHALGHHSIRSTELYVRREPPGLRRAMEGRRYAA